MKTRIVTSILFVFLSENDTKNVITGKIPIFRYQRENNVSIFSLPKEAGGPVFIESDTIRNLVAVSGLELEDLRIKIPIEDLRSKRREFALIEKVDLPVRFPLDSVVVFFPDLDTSSGYASEEKINAFMKKSVAA